MKFYELRQIWEVLDEKSVEQLNGLKRPAVVRKRHLLLLRLYRAVAAKWKRCRAWLRGDVAIPENLDECSIGQILTLSQSNDTMLPFKELLHLTDEQIALLSVEEAIGFLNFVRSELERINKLLSSARAEPSIEERQAGVESVGKEVGSFATIDYLAKRCNITHDQAFDLKWPRVLAMYRLDRDSELFRRRLTEVYRKKQ